MPTALASNFLTPDPTLLVLLALSLIGAVALVLWPLVETVHHRQWGYTLGVVLLGPLGGLFWFAVGRPGTLRQATGRRSLA